MRAICLLACCLLTFNGCGLTHTSKPEQQPPQPIKRVVVVKKLQCNVPESPVPDPAVAQNVDQQTTEEQRMTGAFAQVATRLKALWECVNKHNKEAK